MECIEIEKLYNDYFPDERIVEICKKIVWADGHHANPWVNKEDLLSDEFRNDYEDDELIRLLLEQQMLYFIVTKAKQDNFTLEEWDLFEVPYADENGQIWCFANKKDFHQYHTLKQMDINIGSIDFYVAHTGEVFPSALEKDKHGFADVTKATCQEAIYYHHEKA